MNGLWLLSYVVLWLLALFSLSMLIAVLRHVGLLYERTAPQGALTSAFPSALRAGQPAPDLSLVTPEGERVKISHVTAGHSTTFAIVSPHCSGCATFLDKLRSGEVTWDGERFGIISIGSLKDTEQLIGLAGVPSNGRILLDGSNDTGKAWGITATPSLVTIDDHFKVGRQVIAGVTEETNETPIHHDHNLQDNIANRAAEAKGVWRWRWILKSLASTV